MRPPALCRKPYHLSPEPQTIQSWGRVTRQMGLRICFQFPKGCSRHIGISEVPACPRGDQRDSENISSLAEPWALCKEATGHEDFNLEGGIWTGECPQQGTDPAGHICHKYALEEALNYCAGYTYLGPFCFSRLLKTEESQRRKKGDNYGSHLLYLKASCVPHVRAIH